MTISRRDYDEIVNQLDEAHAEIDELVDMLLWCNPVPAKKTQYEALMDKHRGSEIDD